MKRDRLLTFLWAWAIAFALAAGTAGCLATAFEFGFPFRLWAALAVGTAAVTALCALPFGFLTGAVTVGAAGYAVWRWGSLSGQLSTLVEEITDCYRKGYGWPVFFWAEAQDPETVVMPFLLTGLFIALVAARVVARRGRTFWAVLAAAPFISLCIVLNDTVPDGIYIALLLFSMTLLLLTQTLRRKDEKQANRLAVLTALPLVLALTILFAAVPREGYIPPEEDLARRTVQWFQNLEPGQKAVDRVMSFVTGIGKEKLNLKTTGPRGEQKYKVMEVTAESDGTLYLRGRAYDIYDGRQWIASEGEWQLDGDYQNGAPLGQVEIRTVSVHDLRYFPVNTARSTADALWGGYLSNPEGLNTYSIHWYDPSEETLAIPRYKLSSDGTGTRQISGSGEDLAARLAKQYLQLPDRTREAALAYLKANLPGFTAQPEDFGRLSHVRVGDADYSLPLTAQADMKMEADFICELVRGSARYDLSTQRMPAGEDDFAMWFLNGSDTGYCVHFATAATVLLRAAGIPARYVEGYLVSAREGTAVDVLGEDAHAWVEYWVPGLGWQLLEATPGYGGSAPEPTEPEETLPDATLPDETEPEISTQPDTPDEPDRPTRPRNDSMEPTGGTSPLPGGDKGWPSPDLTPLLPVFKGLAILLGAAAALFAQWKLRLKARLKKLAGAEPNRQALLYWRELVTMWRLLKEAPSEELEALSQKAKFSQHTLTETELDAFRSARAQAVTRLRGRGLPARILYRLVLALY